MIDGHDFRELNQGALRGTVSRAPGAADTAQLRSDQDDRSAAARDHQRQSGTAQQKRSGQIDRYNLLPISHRGLDDATAAVIGGGAAHQNVETAESVPDRSRDRQRVVFARNIAAARNGPPARRLNEACGLLGARQIDVAARDRSTRLGVGNRDCAADAPRGSADERRLTGQLHSSSPAIVTTSPYRRRSRWFDR